MTEQLAGCSRKWGWQLHEAGTRQAKGESRGRGGRGEGRVEGKGGGKEGIEAAGRGIGLG